MNLPQTGRENSRHPLIIQGGMGIGVSNWKLVQTVKAINYLVRGGKREEGKGKSDLISRKLHAN